MTHAWETTTDDVANVLRAHGIQASDERLAEIHDALDLDEIKDNLLSYCSMDAQTSSMLDDLEDQLMEQCVIPKGDKKFTVSVEEKRDYEADDDCDEVDG